MEEAKAATEALASAIRAATADAAAMGAAMAAASDGVDQQARAAEYLMIISGQLAGVEWKLAEVTTTLGVIQRDTADASLDLMGQNELLAASFAQLNGQIDSAIAHLAVLGAAQMTAGQAAANADKGVRTFTRGLWLLGLTGNQIHWIIAGTAEFLAVALPAAIALASGAFVLYQGIVENVGVKLKGVYGATEATAAMIGKTTGDVLGLGHAFQTAQNQANPIAYELLGEYINTARTHMVNLASAGLQVAQALGELGARMQVDLTQHSAQFSALLSHMVTDLIQLGQVLGNVGHAILNFAADMPGLAEVLLLVLDTLSHFLLVISSLPAGIITSFVAFEEFIRWGGLLVGLLGRLTGGVAGFAEALGAGGLAAGLRETQAGFVGIAASSTHFFSLLRGMIVGAIVGMRDFVVWVAGLAVDFVGLALSEGVATAATYVFEAAIFNLKVAFAELEAMMGPAGWALLAIGALAGLVIAFHEAKSAAQSFGDALESAVAKSANVNALTTISHAVGEVNARMAQTPKTVQEAGAAFRYTGDMVQQANPAYATLSSYQQKLQQQFQNTAAGVAWISKNFGFGTEEALAFADAAGVKLYKGILGSGQAAQIARAQLLGMASGYARLDQYGTTLGNDMAVLTVQAGLQGTKVQQLNQAWDQFIGNATGLTSSLAVMNTDIAEIGNQGTQTARKFQVFSGTYVASLSRVAQQLTSFTGKGAQAWQNYDAAVSQAQQYTDNLRIAAAYGGITQTHFTQAVAYSVAELLPYAQHSKTATSELSALAQEAGGPATDNFKTLRQWVDSNKISADEFAKIIQTATGAMSNAGAAALQFAGDLQSDLQAELAKATLQSSNLSAAMDRFQKAVLASGGQISTSSPQYKALYDMLRAAGYSAQQARNELRLLQQTIDALHGKSIDINVAYTQSGNRPSNQSLPGGYPGGVGGMHGMMVGFQGGGMVYGPGGADVLHAMLTAGEAVLTARAVAALGGPMAIHSLNNQPSQAVLTSGGGGGGGGTMAINQHVSVMLDGSKIGSAWRTDLLTYNRRNPTSNTSLRAR